MNKIILTSLILIGISSVANAQSVTPTYGWSLDRPTISGSTVSPEYGSTNLTTTASPTTNVDAIVGQGITTNGTSQYFGVASNIVTTNGSWSICYWVKPNNTGVGVNLSILSPTLLWDGFYIFGGRSLVNVRNSTFGSSVIAPNITSGRWGHVCVTKNATTMSAYGNGMAAAANPVTITQTPLFSDQQFYIGADIQLGGATNYWSGTIDDVRVFTREISGGEARMIYYQGVGSHSFNF